MSEDRDPDRDNKFVKVLETAFSEGLAHCSTDKELAFKYARSVAHQKENIGMFLCGEPRVSYTLYVREGDGLKRICHVNLNDLRQGDRIRPHFNLGWFRCMEIWKPEGFFSGGKHHDSGLIVIVEPTDAPQVV